MRRSSRRRRFADEDRNRYFEEHGIDPEAAATCGGTAVATTPGLTVTQIVGTSDRIEFLVPGSLDSGLYFVSVSGMSSGGTTFSSGNCSQIQVTKTATVFGSCNPGSSMGILVTAPVSGGTVPVTAYVPNSGWGNNGTGVQAVPMSVVGVSHPPQLY